LIEVKGKGSVARILKDSLSPQGHRLTTMEIEVSRIVWCEFLTHGMLARNAHSSRAIPFNKMVEQLTGKPVRFGEANKGMQDKGEEFDAMVEIPAHLYEALEKFLWDELDGLMLVSDLKSLYEIDKVHLTAFGAWNFHRYLSVDISRAIYDAGYHKQVYNRLTEAHQMAKAVVSATEWDNYYWLRDDVAADPTLHDLASTMRKAHEQSVPQLLQPGEWHLPYVDEFRGNNGEQLFCIPQEFEDGWQDYTILTLEEAIKVSSARTGAVSFRAVDYGLEQCLRVYDKLVGDDRKHASAMQHQATPQQPHIYEHGFAEDYEVNDPKEPSTWEPGISHASRDGNLWSAQFCGWIMNRKLIPGENYKAPK
jgi:hypothetical protein